MQSTQLLKLVESNLFHTLVPHKLILHSMKVFSCTGKGNVIVELFDKVDWRYTGGSTLNTAVILLSGLTSSQKLINWVVTTSAS